MSNAPAEVVVSYSRRDSAFVLRLVEALREAGVRVWIDQGGINGALLWGAEIVEAICACRVVILVASSATLQSHEVTKEILIASEEKKPILPIHLEAIEIPASLRLPLAGIQRLDWSTGSWDSNLEAVLRSLERLGVGFSRKRRRSAQRRSTAAMNRPEVVHAEASNADSLANRVHVSGTWQGSWRHSGSKAPFEGVLDLRRQRNALSGVLTVNFVMNKTPTAVREQIEGRIAGRRIFLHATSWAPVLAGPVEHYLLDRFELEVSPDDQRLSGRCTNVDPPGKAEFARVPPKAGSWPGSGVEVET